VAHKVIYVDTDSSFVQDGGANISPQLNDLVQEWSLTRFGRPSTIRFEYEGHFDRILILSKCHYYGYLQGVKKPEIKGIEAKRANSCKYEAKFQEELINRVLDGQSKQQVTEWIRSETLAITTFPCEEMAFPSKITAEAYKTTPIFVRAARNSKKRYGLNIPNGNLFYYVFVRPLGVDEDGNDINVLAFTQDQPVVAKDPAVQIDWDEHIRRCITNKAETIFETMGWGDYEQSLMGQTSLW
jgi:DNA polymerase elongation subunit (family B)